MLGLDPATGAMERYCGLEGKIDPGQKKVGWVGGREVGGWLGGWVDGGLPSGFAGWRAWRADGIWQREQHACGRRRDCLSNRNKNQLLSLASSHLPQVPKVYHLTVHPTR